ncbi:threonylcarbamoyl-AMP synthase [candidate division WOR-1 bacterium RIFOXYC2_FULL_37_10]|uniref:L-threonylcarbamoyladenylate synthase n=1 Tax=candidate division WOR-1 bacterium RIFOXYB2_FULL_37_13 TaxID=1802579 RepID=A0A1F4SWZ2_UNCSA|nr:MAG: threonylcarbamoyl-AMP synthase [candidate division WOR-1 bacterium RIFOXYA2_FULL_37_7]OGC24950.1 MAG: threonylcarbamoyl-AMP synthase [candidate division WOR-1 bacterium RIFOXYB2_FULL_37_13]OGC32397.1 MAG: threonylcarbamoyl-AMP synthase [candidate division WOR-1 bacterium RIFOXYC2_FULL_37_10]
MKKLDFNEQNLQEAVHVLKNNGIIIFPTETVYGIGCLVSNVDGIKRLFEIKNRPADKPFQILISDIKQVAQFAKEINQTAKDLMTKNWPGPLTLVFKKKPEVSNLITANKDTVGLRMPDHPLLLKLIKQIGPIAASSANSCGEPAPIDASQVKIEADLLLDGGKCKLKRASKVVEVTEENLMVIRN